MHNLCLSEDTVATVHACLQYHQICAEAWAMASAIMGETHCHDLSRGFVTSMLNHSGHDT